MKIRHFGCIQLSVKRHVSTDYLVNSLAPLQTTLENARQSVVKTPKRNGLKSSSKAKKSSQLEKKMLNSKVLYDIFLDQECSPFSSAQITKSQAFFNNSKISLDWVNSDYYQIPDVKYQALKAARQEKLANASSYNLKHKSNVNLNPRGTFGITPDLLRPLPEVLIMGYTNAGKSSLINNLLTPEKALSRADQLAYVSAKAGYTKTLTCFKVGNKLRFIDSPGYGERGQLKQGELVVNYLEKRTLLKKVLLVVDSVEGVREEDLHIIDLLTKKGIPFDVIFTKLDLVLKKFLPKTLLTLDHPEETIKRSNQAILQHYNDLIENAGLRDLPVPPRFMFNNSQMNSFVSEYSGFKAIRCSILESCNLLR
ncbi:uncharacterized protein LODBEIA_P14300 [Lodderomyces beijingensis]|uniref:EngB-type G domain-containing protein n=1 Tax=Lodderomyces beijingensis TaxID=1775926 RepID=A0ABP0ZJ93_9ASCO